MKHPSDEALVDLAEGAETDLDHLEQCAVCRERVQAMRQTVGLIHTDRVPEPSPLFWGYLSERISRAVGPDPIPTETGWTVSRWSWGVVAIAAVLVAVLIVIPIQRKRGSAIGSDDSVASLLSQLAQSRAPADDVSWASADAGESWQIVEGAAADLDVEAAVDAGIFVRAGSIDRELLMLSDQERHDLARAIRTELDRSRL